MASDEKDLLERCLAGDDAAWTLLVQRYAPYLRERLSWVCAERRLPRAPDDIDEVLSKVWEDLLRDDKRLLRLYRPGTLLHRWLLTIAVHRLLSLARDRGREENLFEAVRPVLLSRDLDGPLADDAALGAERELRMLAAVRELPPRERLAVRAFYWADWPHARIARILRIPVRQVGPLLQSARPVWETFCAAVGLFAYKTAARSPREAWER